jgi:hypothetical protein
MNFKYPKIWIGVRQRRVAFPQRPVRIVQKAYQSRPPAHDPRDDDAEDDEGEKPADKDDVGDATVAAIVRKRADGLY